MAKPGKRFFCALGGIDTSTVSVTLRTNNTAELTFTVDKYVDGVESQGYEELDEMMELYCDGIWYKIMDPPTETNDGTQCTKDITAECTKESFSRFSQINDCRFCISINIIIMNHSHAKAPTFRGSLYEISNVASPVNSNIFSP